MSSTKKLLTSIEASVNGLALSELLAQHPDIARRTAQRQIAKLIEKRVSIVPYRHPSK